ncbi:MAG: hypothetical protein IJB73_03540 [Firmicutes bacterium]|nr:hypothetical protein [Bacillota bacterium]
MLDVRRNMIEANVEVYMIITNMYNERRTAMKHRLFILALIIVTVLSTISNAYASEIGDELQPDGNGPRPSKYTIRNNMAIVVAGGRLVGYDMAADFLEHSLTDNPTDLYYGAGSEYSIKVKESDSYRNVIEEFKSIVENTDVSPVTYPNESTTLNSTKDLFLAINRAEYSITGQKTANVWNLTIVFKDTYNFEYANWAEYSDLTGNAAVALNNYGSFAEDEGAIVAYDVYITVTDFFVV